MSFPLHFSFVWSPVTPVRDDKIDNPRPQPGCSSTVKGDESGILLDVGLIEDCFQYNSEFVSGESDVSKK